MANMKNHTDHSVLNILGLKDKPQQPLEGPPKNRQRRNRTMFSDHALRRLEDIFDTNPYPDIYAREEIASELNISESRVQVWFQNRRSRKRKISGTGPKQKNAQSKTLQLAKPTPVIYDSSYQNRTALMNPYWPSFPSMYQPHFSPSLDYRNFMNIFPLSTSWSPSSYISTPGFKVVSPVSPTANEDVKSSPEVSSTTSTPTRKHEVCIQKDFSNVELRQADSCKSKSLNSSVDSEGDASHTEKSTANTNCDITAVDLSTRIRIFQ